MKKITLCLVMFFFWLSGFSQLVENFDDDSVGEPAGATWVLGSGTWHVFDNGFGTVNWGLNPQSTYPAYSGTKAAYMNRANIGAGNTSRDFLASPAFEVPQNPQLRFQTRTTVAGNQNTIFEVRMAPSDSDPTDPASYTTVLASWTEVDLVSNFDEYEEKVVDLSLAPGTMVHIAFVRVFTQPTGAIGGDRWIVDDIKLIQKCEDPTNLTVTPFDDNANISWGSDGSSDQWLVHVLPDGVDFDPEAGTPLLATTNTNFNITHTTQPDNTPLTALTDYVVYVQAQCPNSPSAWVEVEFTTQAAPPECGGNFVDEGGIDGNYPNNSNSTITICPENPGDLVTVVFTSFDVESNWDGIYVYDGDSVNAPPILSGNGPGNGGLTAPGAFWGTVIPGPFEATSASGCLTFRFVSDGLFNMAGWTANIICGPPPTCPKPTAITATGTTASETTVSWTAVGPATEWMVFALPCGAQTPSVTTPGGVTSTETSVVLTGLNPTTCYDIFVIAMCEGGDNSPTTNPISTTTQVAPPECGGVFVDEGGLENYPNNSNSTVTICPENPGDLVTVVFTQFDVESNWDGMYVYDGNSVDAPLIPSTNGPGNGQLTVAGAYWGTTIPGPFEATSASGCLTFRFLSDGVVNRPGWMANVICAPPPSCPKPSAVTVTNTTAFETTVSWTPVGPATEWMVFAVPCDGPVPTVETAGGVTTTDTTIELTGLDASTCYDIYVIAVCSDADSSPATNPIEITTEVAPPVCGGQYIDEGGPQGNYPNGSNSTVTICPENPGDIVTVVFLEFNTEANWDGIYVYDGNSTAAPQIMSENGPGNGPMTMPGAFWGTAIPEPFESTSPDGCLTFNFRSDTSVNRPGWVANVICSPPPACQRPTNLTAGIPTHNTVDISFTPNGLAESWLVFAVPCGSPMPTPDSAGGQIATDSNYTVTGLDPLTCYDIYVYGICVIDGEEQYSMVLGPRSVTTQIAPPACGQPFTDAGGPDANYPNSSNSVVTICPENPGDIVEVVFSQFNTETNWDGLYVFDGNSVDAPQIASDNPPGFGNLNMPGAFWGTEIPGPFESSSPDGCLTFWFISDSGVNRPGWVASVNCGPAPTCLRPSNVFVSEITEDGITITWDDPNGATEWHVLVLPASAPIPAEDATGWEVATSSPYTYTGTFNQEQYTVYVRAVCSDDDWSKWSLGHTFNPAVISTSLTLYTEHQLVEDVLLNSNCAQVSNVTFSTANGIGYFSKNASSFPFADGVILTTGHVNEAPGPNTDILGYDGGMPGDADLEAIIFEATGEPMDSQNASVLEFDFVPLTSQLSFNFIFASEEYGTFQCSYSDAFAFLLTNVTLGTPATNLAVLPNSTTPVSVVTIRNQLYNTGCASVNEEYFSQYYLLPQGVDPQSAPINFNGVTVPLTASATVIPGHTYHIKLVVADRLDTNYDSAVFIEGGSFNIGDIEFGQDFLEADGTALCEGQTYTLDTGLGAEDFTFVWSRNGEVIEGQSGNTLLVTQEGVYSVEAFYTNTTCSEQASITIEYFNPLSLEDLPGLGQCNSSGFAEFTLTDADADVLGDFNPAGHTVTYYLTEADATAGTNPLGVTYTNETQWSQTIYVRLENLGGCVAVGSMDLTVSDTAPVFELTPDVTTCAGSEITLAVTTEGTGYTYVWSHNGETLPDTTPSIVVTLEGEYTVIVNNGGCIGEASVNVTLTPGPVAPDNATACGSFTLPELTGIGNYYTESQGQGTQLAPGDIITESQTIWVYAEGCPEVSFDVTIDTPIDFGDIADVTACGSYDLPVLEFGVYYADADGTTPITGPITAIGDTTVFVIAPDNGSCPGDSTSFTVTIQEAISLDPVLPVVSCDVYVLPGLALGNYFTGPNGTGTQVGVGTEITQSTTLYIFAGSDLNPECSDEQVLDITINSVADFTVASGCREGEYTLEVVFASGESTSGYTYAWSTSDGNIAFEDGNRIVVDEPGDYSVVVSWVSETQVCSSAPMTVSVGSVGCMIQKGISANGDGLNDTFDLRGFNVSRLQIFNRYGTTVYERSNYTNEWYGQSDKGDALPDGTYYYVIERNDAEPTRTGWIYVNRKN